MVHAIELSMKAFSPSEYTEFPLQAEEKIERRII